MRRCLVGVLLGALFVVGCAQPAPREGRNPASQHPQQPYDFSQYKLRRIIDPPKFQIYHDYFSERIARLTDDNKYILASKGFDFIKVFRIPEGTVLAETSVPGRSLVDFDVTPDGKHVIALWATHKEGKSERSVTCHATDSLSLTSDRPLSLQSNIIIALSNDGDVALASSSKEIGVYKLHLERPKLSVEEIKKLIAGLGSESSPEREKCRHALAEQGDKALPYLREALQSDDPETRYVAGVLIRDCTDPQWKSHITLKNDFTFVSKSPDCRFLAVSAPLYSGLWDVSTGEEVFSRGQEGRFFFPKTSTKFMWSSTVDPFERDDGIMFHVDDMAENMGTRFFKYDAAEGRYVEYEHLGSCKKIGEARKDDDTGPFPPAGVSEACYLDDGNLIALSWGGVFVYDVDAKTYVQKIRERANREGFNSGTLLSNGSILLRDSAERSSLYRIEGGRLSRIDTPDAEKINYRKVSPDGRLCLQVSADGYSYAVRSMADNKIVYQWERPKEEVYFYTCVFLKGSQCFLVAPYNPGKITMLSTETWKEIWSTQIDPDEDYYNCFVPTPDGKQIICYGNKFVKYLDVETGKILRTFAEGDYDRTRYWLQYSNPDPSMIIVRGHSYGPLTAISTKDYSVLWQLPLSGRNSGIALLGDDGKKMAVYDTTEDGVEVLVCDLATANVLARAPRQQVGTLLYLGEKFAIGYDRGELRILDAHSMQVLHTLQVRFTNWLCLGVMPVDDWKRILIMPRDGSVWEFAPQE
jgi:WD40 repeat protein